MKQVRLLPTIIMIFMIAACQRIEEPEEIAAAGGTFVPVLTLAQPVTMEELAAAPEVYLDQYIQLSGVYEPVSKLVCIDESSRPNPASWSISDGNLVALVGGFDPQINELLPAGIEATVNGFWRFWEGLVGCGKQAERTQVWYLEATTLVSPSPLVRLTLTPSGEIAIEPPEILPTLPAGSPTPDVTETIAPVDTGTPTPDAPPGPIGPPEEPPTASPDSTEVISSPTPVITATVPVTGSEKPTESFTPTPSPDADTEGTATPIPGGTATPTAGGTATPSPEGTPTATPNANGIIVHGNINSQSLILDTLSAGVGHQFSFDVNAGETISVSLVMVRDGDPTFRLLDPDGDVIAERNENQAGALEKLINFPISETGEYSIVIREVSGIQADYSMTMGNINDDFVLVFHNPLVFDQTEAALIKEDHLDYWHFYGELGDKVTIFVEPTGNADMAFRLRDPQLQHLDDNYVNDGEGGEAEEATFELPATGMYTIDVEEWEFLSGDYEITLTLDQE